METVKGPHTRIRFGIVFIETANFLSVFTLHLLRLIHMYPATESGRSESGPFVINDYFLWLFSLEEHQSRKIPHRNIRTVAATYGCKMLHLYEYDANVYEIRCDSRMKPQEYRFMQHKRQLITGLRYFWISMNSSCLKIKIITRNIMFL